MNNQEVREMWMATPSADFHLGPSSYVIQKVKVHKKGEPKEHPKLWWTEQGWPVYEGYQVFDDRDELKRHLIDSLEKQKQQIEAIIEHTKNL